MVKVRFAHLADLHLGSFRDKVLTNLNFKTFQKAIDRIILEKVEFCLFAGDIFNNAMPPLDLVEKVVSEFIRLKENNIGLYVIGGSHDYSNSGKSFISLLEKAKVFVDVSKYEVVGEKRVNLKFFDINEYVRVSGILGKKNGLDKNIYENLNDILIDKSKFNIFMFHTTLDDIKPDFLKNMKSNVTSAYLPKGFDYYAGGHVHTFIEKDLKTGAKLSYPGPLFPNSFSELKREKCSFNLCEVNIENKSVKIERVFIDTIKKEYVCIDIDNLTSAEASKLIEDKLLEIDVEDKILLLEIKGVVNGKITDIGLNGILKNLYNRGVLTILKNTYKLTSLNVEDVKTYEGENLEDIEVKIIDEIVEDKMTEKKVVLDILKLELQKLEGEKVNQFEDRVIESFEKSLKF